MPDYRRFNGPEDSVSYKRFTKDYVKTYEELYSELFSENGRRRDGRTMDQSRHTCMFLATANYCTHAKGSAYIEMSNTKVACSVFDPREIPHQNEFSQMGQIFCEVKFAPFSCPRQRRPHVPDAEEKALSEALRKALEPAVCRHLFPNFQVDVFVCILENDGSCLAAAINAAGLALADALVPMYDVITACTVAVIDKDILVDPTEKEEHLALLGPPSGSTNHGVITMAMLSQLEQVTNFKQVGSIDVEYVTKAMDILEEECKKAVPYIHRLIVSNIIKCFEERKELDKEANETEEILQKRVSELRVLFKKNRVS